MGLKLELIVIVFTLAILTLSMTVEISRTRDTKKVHTAELEFTHTTTREVDDNRSLSVSYGEYGIRDAGVLTVHNLRYHTANIKLLTAERGRYQGDNIYLDNNVTVRKEKGSNYYTDHAVYNQKTGILNVTSPFIAMMGKNIMHGDTLRYDSIKKEAYADNVDADVYTSEK